MSQPVTAYIYFVAQLKLPHANSLSLFTNGNVMRALELHAHAKQVQRSEGKSAVAAAAYRAGEKLYEERTDLNHDYTRKQGVEFKRIYLPEDAPQNLNDRETLWNAAEKKENRSNSCTAHELEVGFPYEFNAMQRREAGDKIAKELMRRYGCAVDVCLHKPNANNDERNFHAHILFTTRGFDPNAKDGWAKTKYRDLSQERITVNGSKTTKGQQEVLSLRQFIAGTMNDISKRDGLTVQVEHLSFEKRGIDKEPQIHLGPVANDMKKNGIETERDTQNSNIIDLNKVVEDRRRQVQDVQYESFDEFAGAKRAELQQWKWDIDFAETRRCDNEHRKLEKTLHEFYGERDSECRAKIDVIKHRLSHRGVKGSFRELTGAKKRDDQELINLQKTLKSGEIRKKEQRDILFAKQKKRREELDKRYQSEKVRVEEDIAKARSLFPSEQSEGKSGDTGDTRSISPVSSTTYDKVKAKVLSKKKANENSTQSKSERTPSYAGSDIKYQQRKRLKNKHSEAVKSKDGSFKKAKREAPEFNYTPPRGPSRGR
ncbi:MobA/MobL family protein [Porticoccus sp. GXU_MW_L64]